MNYPLARNHFRVEWGGNRIGFSEVSGLTIQMDAPEFREGSSPENSKVTMPGMLHYPHLVLKRTVVKGDNDCFNWINTVRFNQIERRDITISLLNERHEPVVTWKFKSAFPVKLDYSSLDAHNGGPMMEIMEITHEGMIVEHL